jgi:hypothetical protein
MCHLVTINLRSSIFSPGHTHYFCFLLPFVSRLGLGFSSLPPLQQYVVTVILGDVIRFVVPFDRVRGTTARACQVRAPPFQDGGQRVGVAGAGDGAFTAAELCCVICSSPRAGTQGAPH